MTRRSVLKALHFLTRLNQFAYPGDPQICTRRGYREAESVMIQPTTRRRLFQPFKVFLFIFQRKIYIYTNADIEKLNHLSIERNGCCW